MSADAFVRACSSESARASVLPTCSCVRARARALERALVGGHTDVRDAGRVRLDAFASSQDAEHGLHVRLDMLFYMP